MTHPACHGSLWAAAALAAALAAPAAAQSQAHSHDGAAATAHALKLNQGRKWATDAPLREGMTRIRALVAPRLDDAHAGRLTPAQYRELAARIEGEVGTIVAECKLEPQADAMLHLVIADLLGGAEAMAGKQAGQRPGQGMAKVAQALDGYGRYFDHPGFRPLTQSH